MNNRSATMDWNEFWHNLADMMKVYILAAFTYVFNTLLSIDNLNKLLLILTIIYTIYKIITIHRFHKKNVSSKEHPE